MIYETDFPNEYAASYEILSEQGKNGRQRQPELNVYVVLGVLKTSNKVPNIIFYVDAITQYAEFVFEHIDAYKLWDFLVGPDIETCLSVWQTNIKPHYLTTIKVVKQGLNLLIESPILEENDEDETKLDNCDLKFVAVDTVDLSEYIKSRYPMVDFDCSKSPDFEKLFNEVVKLSGI